MPPRRFSRYATSEAIREGDLLVLTDPRPARFRDRPDNRIHVVQEGDTLHSLAHRYFPGFRRPAGLWWVVAEYQPEPILDGTRRLPVGEVIYLPSERTLREEILGGR